MAAIQSDVSRILAADWKTIKETPAALAKGVVELENFGKGTPVQEMRLEQRKSANDFGLWARTKMMEPAMAAMLASYKETGGVNFMATPKVAGIALRAAFYSFFGMDEDVVDNLSHDQTLELQKTIEAAPEGKIKNITLTAVEFLHKEHMAAHSAIPAAIAASAKDPVMTPPNYADNEEVKPKPKKRITQLSPLLDASTSLSLAPPVESRPWQFNFDVEKPTVDVTRSNFPVKVNTDGSISTIVSMSFQAEEDGPEILIPTVIDGKQLTEQQAKDHYFRTGEHFGKFSTPEKANAYAEALHLEEEKSVSTNEKLWFDVVKTDKEFKTEAYKGDDGRWAIGAGVTSHQDGTPVRRGDVIDAAKIDMYVRLYTYNTVIPILSYTIPKWDRMQANQQAALISFAYNMGPNFIGAENRETLTAALRSPLTWYKVPAALMLYNKAISETSGKLIIVQDLIKRRQAEANLWKTTK